MDWIILGGYSAVGLVVWWKTSRRLLWHMEDELGAEPLDTLAATSMALIAGMCWPVAVMLALGARTLKRDLDRNHPKRVSRRQQERDYELARREREIRRMERELGITK